MIGDETLANLRRLMAAADKRRYTLFDVEGPPRAWVRMQIGASSMEEVEFAMAVTDAGRDLVETVDWLRSENRHLRDALSGEVAYARQARHARGDG